jgi:hypothetical protein
VVIRFATSTHADCDWNLDHHAGHFHANPAGRRSDTPADAPAALRCAARR